MGSEDFAAWDNWVRRTARRPPGARIAPRVILDGFQHVTFTLAARRGGGYWPTSHSRIS